MADTDVHVVVGAAGAAGMQVVKYLHLGGHRVRAVTRDGRGVGTPGVELAAADASNQQSVAAACRGAAVVYHCVMPPINGGRPTFPRSPMYCSTAPPRWVPAWCSPTTPGCTAG
jgi:nucleoside-diphosphate-sugar epimerase